jgi:hypothetical protein
MPNIPPTTPPPAITPQANPLPASGSPKATESTAHRRAAEPGVTLEGQARPKQQRACADMAVRPRSPPPTRTVGAPPAPTELDDVFCEIAEQAHAVLQHRPQPPSVFIEQALAELPAVTLSAGASAATRPPALRQVSNAELITEMKRQTDALAATGLSGSKVRGRRLQHNLRALLDAAGQAAEPRALTDRLHTALCGVSVSAALPDDLRNLLMVAAATSGIPKLGTVKSVAKVPVSATYARLAGAITADANIMATAPGLYAQLAHVARLPQDDQVTYASSMFSNAEFQDRRCRETRGEIVSAMKAYAQQVPNGSLTRAMNDPALGASFTERAESIRSTLQSDAGICVRIEALAKLATLLDPGAAPDDAIA